MMKVSTSETEDWKGWIKDYYTSSIAYMYIYIITPFNSLQSLNPLLSGDS